MKDFIKGTFLFVIALIPTVAISILSILSSLIYYLVSFNWQLGLSKLGKYFLQMALSIDQFANVSIQNPLTWLLIKKNSRQRNLHYKFGDEDNTVSYVIAMNYEYNTLNKHGLFWAWFLDFVDKDHLQKSIENKKQRDLEAWLRIEKKN